MKLISTVFCNEHKRVPRILWPRQPHWVIALAVLLASNASDLRAQRRDAGPPEAQTVSGFPTQLPLVPEAPPRSPDLFSAFADRVTSNDAIIQLIVRQGRILTLQKDLTSLRGDLAPVIAVGDPSVVDFRLVGPRQIRVIGQKIGVTDLSITTASGETFAFQVQVTPDLDKLRAQMAALFPTASLRMRQIRDYIVVEGEARSTSQSHQIIDTINNYLISVQNAQVGQTSGQSRPGQSPLTPDSGLPSPTPYDAQQPDTGQPLGRPPTLLSPDEGDLKTQSTISTPQVINLIRVPGPQQILLKVQVAELNRTALRQIGGDFEFNLADMTSSFRFRTDTFLSPTPGFPLPTPGFQNPTANINGVRVFDNATITYILKALQRNQILKILAEPNLIALNGHEASFLAGGEFPVPIPQSSAGGGTVITVEYKQFGVRLSFIPNIIDEDTIRLTVSPEVSAIDQSLAIQLQGFNIPALSTRTATTVVEINEAQTLAMAGLLQVTMIGTLTGVPGLTKVPVLGRFFSNASDEMIEKELVVLVTPYMVEGANQHELPILPGDEVDEPNNLEFYLFGRLEGKTLHGYRSTTDTFEPSNAVRLMQLEQRYFRGTHGYSQ